jgi:hypothetical protein
MIDNRQALELIEQTQSDSPFCGCGQQTIALGRGDRIWLECRSFGARPRGLVRRFIATHLGVHTRELVVDLAPAALTHA